MSQARIISEALQVEAGEIRCRSCGHRIGPAGQPWKQSVALHTVACTSLPGAGSNVHPNVFLRQFCCEGCGLLLDTEIALRDDPFLNDILFS